MRAGATPLGRAFWQLWWATAGSSLGDGLVAVAFPLVAYELSHSALAVSVVYASARLPVLLLGIPAGVLADRVGRRRLAVVADSSRCLLLAALVVVMALGGADVAVLSVAAFLLGSLEQLFQASAFSALPSMVDESQLEVANGRLWVADATVEEVVGQGLGGLLVALRRALPFLVDAVSFAFSALLICRALPADVAVKRQETTLRRDAADGFRWFISSPVIRATAALISSFAFCQSAALAVLVVWVRRDLHESAAAYGAVLAVGAIGTVVGSQSTRRVVARVGSVSALLVGGAGAGCAYLMLGLTRSIGWVVVALALEAAATNLGMVASLSLRQRLIPRELLGRVGMTFRSCVFAGMPLGALAAGGLASIVPLPTVFLAAGALQLVVLLAWSVACRRRAPGRPGAHFKRAERVGFEPTVP